MRFREGDTVRIAKGSRLYADVLRCNPRDVNGIIFNITLGHKIQVTWDNDRRSVYEERGLRLYRRDS